MLPSKRCHRSGRRQRLFYNLALLVYRPVPPRPARASVNLDPCLHPSPPVAAWPPPIELDSSAGPRQGGQKTTLTFEPIKANLPKLKCLRVILCEQQIVQESFFLRLSSQVIYSCILF